MKAIIFAQSVVFHTFTFTVKTNILKGQYKTYVGAARKVNSNVVELGIIEGSGTASLVKKTTPVSQKRCKRRFFIKRCSRSTKHVPRGNTANELKKIEMTMRNEVASCMKQQLPKIKLRAKRSVFGWLWNEDEEDSRETKTVTEDLEEEEEDTAVGGDEVMSTEAPVTDRPSLPCSSDLRTCVEEHLKDANRPSSNFSGSSNITRIVRSGFDQVHKSSTVHVMKGIKPAFLPNFLNYFFKNLKFTGDLTEDLKRQFQQELESSVVGIWRSFQMLYTISSRGAGGVEEKKLAYVIVFYRRTDGGFDLAQSRTSLAMSLADDIVLVKQETGEGRETGEDVVIKRIPSEVSKQDVDQAMKLLLTAVIEKLVAYTY